MALLKCDFFSEVLMISTSMTVILPENTDNQIGLNNNKYAGNIPVLYLLHGLSDDHTIWTRRTSIERYAAEYGIAIVMPQVDHSFYTDMAFGKQYWTFLSEELPKVARSFFPISAAREDNFVAGLSMGGYGAFRWALRKPEQFAAAASLSGVMDIASHAKSKQPDENPVANVMYLAFGERDLAGTDHDLFALVRKKEDLPALFQACGTEDFLWEENKKFAQFTKDHHIPVATSFSAGAHEWGFWDDKIQEVLAWLPLKQ
ncbi:alpha/beta hydrolase [Gracilibacillus salinarum]|uniref:Esterase family protein n=1 Tax=Gracilibacillus salinarum TaxID=2932255 RepID=A0ABY4GPS3_9BACI|nr:alpha/beta hydrolase family protein [Gracilibacillus salinarum]UOQ86352.1 esterase family protein [Gracilibacillus salinarum]